jgi:uncharacterized damage-inducible protein DinB
MGDRRLEEAIRHLRPAAGDRPWHGGATVTGALRGLSAEAAAWRPAPERHSIWEQALHVAYTDYGVRRRITGEARGGFPRSPADWPAVPVEPTPEVWAADRALVRESHERLVEAMRAFDPSRLDEGAGGPAGTTYADLFTGILLHETYHAGQIQLLKRLALGLGL